jgi:hypothetical protein
MKRIIIKKSYLLQLSGSELSKFYLFKDGILKAEYN